MSDISHPVESYPTENSAVVEPTIKAEDNIAISTSHYAEAWVDDKYNEENFEDEDISINAKNDLISQVEHTFDK